MKYQRLISKSTSSMAAAGVPPSAVDSKHQHQLTEVVLTPQSNSGFVGEGAGGVSTQSKVLSESEELILPASLNFEKIVASETLEGLWWEAAKREGCGDALCH